MGVTLLYTLFLIFTYVAHFAGDIGASAHSFFRYNTQLELLAMLAIVALARETWVRRGSPPAAAAGRWSAPPGIVLAAGRADHRGRLDSRGPQDAATAGLGSGPASPRRYLGRRRACRPVIAR